jgi:hypothetical protein
MSAYDPKRTFRVELLMTISMRETVVCEALPRCFVAVVGARISMMVRTGEDPRPSGGDKIWEN